jgi:hypothetical protein
MGGAGLGAAFILHQAGIDQFNLFGAGRRLSVGVQLTAVLAIHAEQGVGLAFDPVQSELVIEIDLGVGDFQRLGPVAREWRVWFSQDAGGRGLGR